MAVVVAAVVALAKMCVHPLALGTAPCVQAQLEGRQKSEAWGRKVEGLQQRVEAAEAEVLERMQLIADYMAEAEAANGKIGELECAPPSHVASRTRPHRGHKKQWTP